MIKVKAFGNPGVSAPRKAQERRPRAYCKNSRNKDYQFWRQDNQPKECYSPKFSVQKLNYIHNNAVEAGIVDKAEEYLYSSARDYQFGKNVGLLEIEFL